MGQDVLVSTVRRKHVCEARSLMDTRFAVDECHQINGVTQNVMIARYDQQEGMSRDALNLVF